MKVVNTEKVHIKMWLDDIEEGALRQAKNLANLPFTFHHVALMPDCHQGYGMPIGGVLATDNVVIPNAVGVDIGCGMRACKTSVKEIDLEKVVAEIKKVVPVGFKKHEVDGIEWERNIKYWENIGPVSSFIHAYWINAVASFGTLGGGNHFIELQKDEQGFINIMIHSGSRNLGKQVADHYNYLAAYYNKLWYFQASRDLAFLPLETPQANQYLEDMKFCVKYAKMNRALMMQKVKCVISEIIPEAVFSTDLDVAHNYARLENHYGKNVMVHRKGATSAKLDEIGIIPGSQGTASYIVKGLGNPESFTSCSHGAGRKMGRKEARRTLNLEDEKAKLKGIVHSIKTEKDLDEATGAYKDIDTVMQNQKDLVRIERKLTPIAVIKG